MTQHFVIMLSARTARFFRRPVSKLPREKNFGQGEHWLAYWRCEYVARHEASGEGYFLLTNAKTLYSLMVNNEDGNIVTMVGLFAAVLEERLVHFDILVPENIEGSFSLVRGQPRSLIGSQNELMRANWPEFDRDESSLPEISAVLNQTPMMAIRDLPEDAFRKALQDEPPFASL